MQQNCHTISDVGGFSVVSVNNWSLRCDIGPELISSQEVARLELGYSLF